MNINNKGSNKIEISENGITRFYSYNTLVGVKTGSKVYYSNTKFSKTTSKHINQWLKENGALDDGIPLGQDKLLKIIEG